MTKTPILFIIFNRPETTRKVFEAICKAKPSRLFIAADGPRNNKPSEKKICKEVREIATKVDWPCEVMTLFREKNLGCKIAVSSAISWFFENVEYGIILEDDCLPEKSFFRFCDELLEKYKDDQNISMISGNNFNLNKIGQGDYYFSKIPHIWGWATWKRSWNKYDLKMTAYPLFKNKGDIKNVWSNKIIQNYWLDIFDRAYNDKINTWDYQLTFSVFLNDSLCICPNLNLVSNIGFGNNSTNTLIFDKKIANLKTKEILFPLVFLDKIEYNEANDAFINKMSLQKYRVKKFLRSLGIFNFTKKIYTYALSYLHK